jgi:hypothetical protein
MQNTDIFKILGILICAYPNNKVEKQTLQLYAKMLEDLDISILDQAAKICMTTVKFFPSIAEIRAAAAEVMARATGLPSAAGAWGEVQDLIRDEGWRNNYEPVFSHPVIGKVVGYMGGWSILCGSENQIADRARFIQAYEIEAQRAREDVQFLPETHDQIRKLAEVNAQVKQLAAKLSDPREKEEATP